MTNYLSKWFDGLVQYWVEVMLLITIWFLNKFAKSLNTLKQIPELRQKFFSLKSRVDDIVGDFEKLENKVNGLHTDVAVLKEQIKSKK